ncbi:MAG TPA: phage Gp37/Gp68 family protein [Planktothrix sp.]
MADNSSIEWTDATWNPVTGCTKISPGCAHCYAETFAERFRGVPGHPYEQGFDLKLWPDRLLLPGTWKKPKRIFVNSMSDLFHKDVPEEYVKKVFDVMNEVTRHQYQVLTKRSERLAELSSQLKWGKNIWMGVSVENAQYTYRIDDLRKTGAHVKFLSVEPLLGPIPEMNLKGIDWVIVGGESGHGARQVSEDWIVEIRDQCKAANVPFFFKQWGGRNKKKAGRLLEGRTWDDMPAKMSEWLCSR